MKNDCCCSQGLRYSNNWFGPFLYVKEEKLGNLYTQYPMGARIISTPIAAVEGVVSTVLFPVSSLIGVVAHPIIALGHACCGHSKEAKGWLQAWCFSLLGVGASAAFLMISTYYLPLIASSTLYISFISVSVVIHVFKAVKEPEKKSIIKT